MATIGIPLGNRVLLKFLEVETMSPTGLIIIPDSAQERSEQGHIVAKGEGQVRWLDGKKEVIPIELEVGDHVMFSRYTGMDVKLDGEEYCVVDAKDIQMVIKGAADVEAALGTRHKNVAA